ncbi:MAG: NrfD/PsrC family molybdoenzyme membrane anchor subunit [Pseudomonadales bacterium]
MSTEQVTALANEAAGPEFGMLLVSYLFLMGVSQAGVVFSAVGRLVYAQWAKPYYRLAELSTLAFMPFAIIGFLLIYYYSRDSLFYWLSASPEAHLSSWLDIEWLFIRNILGLIVFYGLSAFYILKALGPDLGGASDAGSGGHRAIERQLYLLSPLVIISFVICNTLFAWDFAMMLIPHWHSTVFPIHFWFGNVFAATAAMIAIPVVLGRFSAAEFQFGERQIRQLSMLISAFMLLWLYFFWAQFFVMWFGNLPRETDPLWRQLYGHYAPYFWTMLAGCFFVPFIGLIFSVFNRSLLALCILGFGINLGVWFNKYLMVIPVFSLDAQPLQNLVDVGLSIALLVGFIAVIILLARRLPVYSYWELALKREPEQ